MKQRAFDDLEYLMPGLKHGENAAWSIVYDLLHIHGYAFALKELGDELFVEDAVQDGFLVCFAIRSKIDSIKDLRGLFFTAIRFYCSKVKRAKRRMVDFRQNIFSSQQYAVSYSNIDSITIANALSQLPTKQRMVVELCYGHGYKDNEIAKILKYSLSYVKIVKSKGKAKLLQTLGIRA